MKIEICGVSFAYNGVSAIDGVSLQVGAGEILSLVGPNGSGKTTLLKMVSGLLAPKLGAVYLDGRGLAQLSPGEIARTMSALEQEHSIGFDFSVREVVEWGRIPHQGRLSPWRMSDEAALISSLEITELHELADRSIATLSGGERQRVFLAMALAQEPQVLLLDEPTAHLDLRFQLDILRLVQTLAESGISVLLAIHDLSLAARASHQIAVLSGGRLVAAGPPARVLTPQLVRQVWGVEADVLRNEQGLWVLPKPTMGYSEPE